MYLNKFNSHHRLFSQLNIIINMVEDKYILKNYKCLFLNSFQYLRIPVFIPYDFIVFLNIK